MLLRGRWELQDRGIMDRTHLRWFTLLNASRMLQDCGYRLCYRRVSYLFPLHWHLNLGRRLANTIQTRAMPRRADLVPSVARTFDEWFAMQHILVATPA